MTISLGEWRGEEETFTMVALIPSPHKSGYELITTKFHTFCSVHFHLSPILTIRVMNTELGDMAVAGVEVVGPV